MKGEKGRMDGWMGGWVGEVSKGGSVSMGNT
jgi:hypothetical protein